MRGYRKHPMPTCTWLPESGPGSPWRLSRYRVVNPSSGAAGKFQVIPSTWRAIGGTRYSSSAQFARPVIQERMARRLLRVQGLGAWVNCP